MKKMRKRIALFFALSLCVSVRPVLAKRMVSDFSEFKQLCESDTKETIELTSDIIVDEPVVIRGEKIIHGRGHNLVRSALHGKVYGGCLFLVQGKKCEWSCVTVSGSAGENTKSKIFGRLIEVRQGTLVIGKGCFLQDNVNETLAVNGGGAVKIGSGGVCIMKAGSVRNNKNVSGGAAFYVKKGGRLLIQGGVITGNKTIGVGAVEGFDGRGGAIYSEGSVWFKGGVISGNTAKGYRKGDICYGGVGGAVYVAKGGSLFVQGGTLTNNPDERKEQIYADGKVTGWENKKSKKKEPKQNQSEITKSKQKNTNENQQKHNLMPAKTAKPKPEKTDTIKKEKQQKTDSTEHKKTIMPVMDKKEEIHGRVLYVEPDNTDFVEEKWHFSVDALKVARQFIHRQEKPFSREVNGSFLRQFAKAKKGVVKNE